MPLSADNAVHTNTGTFTGTSGSAALAAPGGVQDLTEAGNTVFLCVYTVGTGTVSTPTGFQLVPGGSFGPANGHAIYLFRRSNVPAGESSWTVTVSVSQLTTWTLREFSNIDVNSPMIGSVGTGGGGPTGLSSVVATGNTTGSGVAVEDQVTLAFFGCFQAGATPAVLALAEVTGSTHSTAVEVANFSGTGGGNAAAMLSADEFPTQTTGLYVADVTSSVTPAAKAMAIAVTFRAKGTALYPTLTHILGGQHGTTAGWTTGTAGSKYLESASAGVSLTTTNPRHDTYAFRCNATTTACNFTSYAVTVAAGVFLGRISFRLNATPGANLELGGVTSGLTFRWVQATGKIGAVVGGGTEQVSTSTVASGSWWTIDYRLDTSGTAWQCEWTLTPDSTLTAETETTATGTGVATTSFTPRVGWTTASTGDVNFADIVCSSTAAAYPLANYQVKGLKIDGSRAAESSDSGVSTDFGLFTNNGTIGAWNATTAPTLLDDLPATIGATADGIAQIAVGSTTAGNEPTVTVYFEAVTLGSTMTCKGARTSVVGWAASGTAANVYITTTVGTAPTVILVGTVGPTPADPGFDNSTTAPAWVCSGVMATGSASTRLTQTNLATAGLQRILMGWSTDAAPDLGMHAAYCELAVKVAPPLTLQRAPDGTAMATLYQDLDTSGYVGLQFTAPADRGMTYSYEFPSGTTNGPTALAAGASSATFTLDANVLTDVPDVTCVLDALPEP